jgi:hypothetical protein
MEEKNKKIKNKRLTSEKMYDTIHTPSFKTWITEMPKFRGSSNGLSVSSGQRNTWQNDEFNRPKPKYVYSEIPAERIDKIDSELSSLPGSSIIVDVNGKKYMPIRSLGVANDSDEDGYGITFKGSSTGKALFLNQLDNGFRFTINNRLWIPVFIAKRFLDTTDNNLYICIPVDWIYAQNYLSYFPELRNTSISTDISTDTSSTTSENELLLSEIRTIQENDLLLYIPLFQVEEDYIDLVPLDKSSKFVKPNRMIVIKYGTDNQDINKQISAFGTSNMPETVVLPRPFYIPISGIVKFYRHTNDKNGAKIIQCWIMAKSHLVERSPFSRFFKKTF